MVREFDLSLVSTGALKRSKIEKSEPTITYEAFVEELDGGDSFTASLIDVLVKVRHSYACTTQRRWNSLFRNWQPVGSVKISQTVVSLKATPLKTCECSQALFTYIVSSQMYGG